MSAPVHPTPPRPRPAGDDVAALLDLMVGDPLHAEDRARVITAIVAAAAANAGLVDPNRVRAALTNEHGRTVYPRVIGAVYRSLAAHGALTFEKWVTSTDLAGGNAGRPVRAYRLTVDAVPKDRPMARRSTPKQPAAPGAAKRPAAGPPVPRQSPGASSRKSRNDGGLRLNDWFCGAGGSTQGIATIPGVEPVHAANHWAKAIESHAANFPKVDHWKGDIRDLDVSKLPYAELFWASPECTTWSKARGKTQDYAVADTALPGFEDPALPEEDERSRALMEEVPIYLRAMALRGRPVLAGVVENVTDIRQWTDWGRWRTEIEAVGYRTRLIALNSMHAQSVRTPRAPQSRDRLYLAYWHVSLGRDPDWDKWLRPTAWCPDCDTWVRAVQVWKRPGQDMGRYRQQYVYACPSVHRSSTGGRVVEPVFSPAYTAIDWALRGERIGDRAKPLAPKTLARIAAGIKRYARPIHVEAAGNTYDAATRGGSYFRAWPVEEEHRAFTTTATRGIAVPPLVLSNNWSNRARVATEDALPTMTTATTTGVVVPPMLVPVDGRDGTVARPSHQVLRTQSTRSETALVTVPPMLVPAGGTWNDDATSVDAPMRTRTVRESEAVVVPPFIAELRGGGSVARPVDDALSTFSAGGTHHGLVVPELPAMVMRNNGSPGDGGEHCTPVSESLRTLTTKGHQSLVTWEAWAALYAYDSGVRSLAAALPTQTTVEGDALLTGSLPAVEDCLFRMLEPKEIGAGMAFLRDYIVLGNRREQVKQFGNAVTPPAAEVIVSALVECITGQDVSA